MSAGSIVQLITESAPSVANFVKAYINRPILGGEPQSSVSVFKTSTWKPYVLSRLATTGVPLEAEEYEESYSAEISQNLLINATQGRFWVTDNVAPMPRTWEIGGYIGGDPLMALFEKSGLFMPSLTIYADRMRKMGQGRLIVWFKTLNNEVVLVGIKELKLAPRSDVVNKIPFRMSLMEINVLYGGEADPQSKASPNPGSSGSSPVSMSQAQTSVVSKPSSFPSGPTLQYKVG